MSKKIAIAIFVAILISVQTTFADFLPVRAYGNDTVAGYAASLKSSLLTPEQDVVFVVEKPDQSVVRVPAKADVEGIAQAELYGHQTKIAGSYKVALVYAGSPQASPQSAFQVYADTVSLTQSTISAVKALLPADGTSETFVTVTLFDAYRNPLGKHALNLISSRSEDRIEAVNAGVTDEKGRAAFKVSSVYPGLSVYSALDNTLNVLLEDRTEVVFQAVQPEDRAIGGNLLRANLFGGDIGQGSVVTSGPVHHFELEGLPATVKVNEELSFTVAAKDKDDNFSKNYTGTILISVPTDENAVLPSNGEYTFKENDQGQFTFNLALQFSKLGRHKLQVFDKANWNVMGEKEVEVVSRETLSPAAQGGRLRIKSPLDGAELGNSLVIISGQGDPNINLKVFDNDAKIGDGETDLEGFFSFEARGLESGSHRFYVMSDKGDVSGSVAVLIDTLPPVLNSFQAYPEGTVKPGEALKIKAQSEPDLESAKVRLQGISEPLLPGADPGTYEATLPAPQAAGRFFLDVILIDKLGNKAELLNQKGLTVSAPRPVAPPQVEGLAGKPGNGTLFLNWQATPSPQNPIDHYRVYYGFHFDQLKEKADTEGPVTTYALSNLTNDTQYFAAVKAVDVKGTESEELSLTIAATPTAPKSTESAFIPAPLSSYQATPLNGAVLLSWVPFPGIQAFYYKVYFGLKQGQYDEFLITPNNTPSLNVHDLINGAPYYFSVAALDLSGREISALSPEFSATPSPTALRASAPPYSNPSFASSLTRVPANEATGPEAFYIIFISLFFAYVLYHQKQKLFKH